MKTPLPALLLALALVPGLAGCRTTSTDGPCEYGFVTTLHLSRSIPGGGVVDDAAFAQFLDEFVSPRFPGGYTVLPAASFWRPADGGPTRNDRAALLQIVRCETDATETALKEIAVAWAERFRQQEILRTDSRTRIWW